MATAALPVAPAQAGATVQSTSAPMLDGTPTLLAGEPLDPCVVIEGGVAMKLISIEDFGEDQTGGPAFARVTYTLGRQHVTEDIEYWRVQIPRADAVGSLADLSVVPTPEGGLAISASLAHRSDRPLHAVDHGTLSLMVLDRVSGESLRMTTWGEWVPGEDGLMEYATLSSPVNCVSLSEFMGDVPPGSPLVGALMGAPEVESDVIWILQGQGLEGDFTFSTWGGLVASPTAIDEVKAVADESGWIAQELELPDPTACTFGGWGIPPIQPCIWTVQPVPNNPPASVSLASGSAFTVSWNGLWSQSGVASAGGAKLSKSQLQIATLLGLTYSIWSPGPAFLGSWAGLLLVDRGGDCGDCPCQAVVSAFPSAKLTGTLDAVALVEAKLAASISTLQSTSSTMLAVTKALGVGGSIELGITEASVELPDGGAGTWTFAENSTAWPAPLNDDILCGEALAITSAFSASGYTHLSGLVDFPWRPQASFEVLGRTKFQLTITPIAGSTGLCGVLPPIPLKWEDPAFPD